MNATAMLPEDCLTVVTGHLEDLAPDGGYAALLLRHPVVGVYFPCAIGEGTNAGALPAELLMHYYLYSAEFDLPRQACVELSDNSSVEDLVLRGKLALALFENGPVCMRTFSCHPDGNSLLCLLARRPKVSTAEVSPSATQGSAELVPSKAMLGRLAAATRVWHFVAPQIVPVRTGTNSERAAHTVRLLADTSPTPPYVPVLYAAVDHAESRSVSRQKGKWYANPLSYNCLLLRERRALAKSFIKAMFDASQSAESTYQELSGLIDPDDVLLQAIVATCRDLVQPIGDCSVTSARAFGRRNIPRKLATDALLAENRYHTPIRPATSNWMLIRRALEYLKGPKDECALVTAWVKAPEEEPMPVGLAPGKKSEALAAIADHPAMSTLRINMRRSSGGLLAASIVPLEHVVGTKRVGEPWAAESIMQSMLDAANPARAEFPGPYLLDFRSGNDLHITSKVEGFVEKRIVLGSHDSDLIEFLFALHRLYSDESLAVAAGRDVSLVGHKMIERQWLAKEGKNGKRRYKSVQLFVDTMKEKLGNGTPPVEWSEIFAVQRSRRNSGEKDGGCYWTGGSFATGFTTEVSRRDWNKAARASDPPDRNGR